MVNTLKEKIPLNISHPKLAEQWDYEKNESLTPEDVTSGSGKKVWWICGKGHKWEAIISNRVKGRGCPICSGKKVLAGYNDLLTVNADIAKEWNFAKNAPVGPDQVTAGTTKKFWWICKNGHEWEISPCHRIKGNGCPICSGQKVLAGYNDLATKRPDLAEEWNYEKNKPLLPSEIMPSSGKKVWWICKKGHEWEADPNNRSNGNGCPFCANKAVLAGYNDLATLSPELAAEWNYEKNRELTDARGNSINSPDKVTFSSGQKVWWKCKYNHEWESLISNRAKGNGCPYCANKRVYLGAIVNEDLNLNKIKLHAVDGKTDIATLYPNIAKEWNYERNKNTYDLNGHDISTPDKLTSGSSRIVWWKCSQGHEWKAVISHRTLRNQGCPFCSNRITISGYNDLASLRPDLAAEWNYERNENKHDRFGVDISSPDSVKPGSSNVVWWKCALGHEWQAAINHRTSRNHGCPYCSGRFAIVGKTDLATLKPELVKEWDYERNFPLTPQDVTSRSGKNVWWKCEKGHSWKSVVSNRSHGHGCPYCAGQRVIKGVNDLTTLNPYFLEEWNYEKNSNIAPDEVTVYSPKKVWWICQYGHEWKTSVYYRSYGSQCPFCIKNGSSMPEQAISFYLSQVCEVKQRVKLFGKEADVYLPQYRIAIEYDGIYYHKHKTRQDKEKEDFLTSKGIRLFRMIESDHNYVNDNHIYFIAEYLGENYEWALTKLIDLLAESTRDGSFRTIDLNIKRDRLKIRERFALVEINNSLAVEKPELAKEWDYEKNGRLMPKMFTPGSKMRVWWKCSNGHSWEAAIQSRSAGYGCPYCSGLKAIKGKTDLATLRPEVAADWNYEKNSSLMPYDVSVNSNKKVWWKCSKGHEWQAAIHSRSQGKKCPYCCGRSHADIMCLETGEIYKSFLEASRSTGANHNAISKCCNGKGKTAGGYHWRFTTE